MLDKINRKLRVIALILVASYVAASFIEEKEVETPDDGFQREKFDDIW